MATQVIKTSIRTSCQVSLIGGSVFIRIQPAVMKLLRKEYLIENDDHVVLTINEIVKINR